eukprot:1300464-Amorphochlora_amoeboformis.AAC.1
MVSDDHGRDRTRVRTEPGFRPSAWVPTLSMTPLRAHRLLRLAVRLGARMRYMERPSSFTVGAVRGLCTSTSGKSKPDKANEHDETFTSTVELKGKKGGSQAEEKSAWTKFWDREMVRPFAAIE